MRLNRSIAGLLAIMVLTAGLVVAQDSAPDRQEAFVYATTHYNGLTYSSGLATPNADTIYMLANVENVIAPRNTLIYYWPLTNEFFADWRRKNELVEGTLEVLQGGQIIREVTLTDFVIQYDSDDIVGTIALHSGQAAQEAYANFTRLQAQYREAMLAHFRAQQAYEEELRAILRDNEPGTVAPEDLPPRPQPPEPLSLFSTDPIRGYILSLPEGAYTIQMRLADGSILPASRRQLIAFSERRNGVAYEVTPRSRWTRPEEALEPHGVIYAPPDTTVYLRPHIASEYNALYYTRMNAPQDETARADRYVWVSHQPLTGVTARIRRGEAAEEQTLTPYFVRQLVSDSRGYDIIEWNTSVSERPSFEGFEVAVTPGSVTVIELLDDNGNPVPSSRREVRALHTGRAWALYGLSFIPLMVGFVVRWERRRQTRRLKLGSIAG